MLDERSSICCENRDGDCLPWNESRHVRAYAYYGGANAVAETQASDEGFVEPRLPRTPNVQPDDQQFHGVKRNVGPGGNNEDPTE